MLSFVSGYFNSWTKVLFAQPRPFNLDPSVGLASEASFGLPSGHAQGTFVLAGYIGKKAKKLLPRILLLLFVMLIAFSRIYLGVHFPTDILGGWMLGAIILAAWLLGERAFGPTIARWDIRLKIVLVALVSFLMNTLFMEGIQLSALLFGVGTGYAALTEKFEFSAKEGNAAQKILRCLMGFGGLLLLYFGLRFLLPKEGAPLYFLFRFVRYGLVGFWVAFIAPYLFMVTKLSPLRARTRNPQHP